MTRRGPVNIVVRRETPGPLIAPLAGLSDSRRRSLWPDLPAIAFSLGRLVRRAHAACGRTRRGAAPARTPDLEGKGQKDWGQKDGPFETLGRSIFLSAIFLSTAAEPVPDSCGLAESTVRVFPRSQADPAIHPNSANPWCHIHTETRLPPLPPCGKITADRTGDGRPSTEHRRRTGATNQTIHASGGCDRAAWRPLGPPRRDRGRYATETSHKTMVAHEHLPGCV